MDARHFDRLTRLLSTADARRGVLRLLAALPLLGGRASLLNEEDAAAKGRRKRHKHGRGRHKGKGKRKKPKKCKPKPRAKTCAGKCGIVKNTCRKRVDCGPCGPCDPPCAADALCLDGQCQPCTVTCPGGTCDGAALQSALAAGSTVYACPGRYTGNFTLDQDISLIGAGEDADPAVDTILDAVGSGRAVKVSAGATVALRGLRITGGDTAGSGGGHGGGLLNDGGTLTLTECTVTRNTVPRFNCGGGIMNADGTLTLNHCAVMGNTAPGAAGICQGSAQPVTLHNSVVENNHATSHGGGILVNRGSSLTIASSSAVRNNTAAVVAGGIYNVGTVTCHGGSVTGNTVADSPSNCLDLSSGSGRGSGCDTCST